MQQIIGHKNCNKCGSNTLDWDRDYHKKTQRWRLSKVYKLEDGTLLYKAHVCEKTPPPQETTWIRPSPGYYCAHHEQILHPNTLQGTCYTCKSKGMVENPTCIEIY